MRLILLDRRRINKLPPFTQWTLHANAVMTSPYGMTLNANASFQESSSPMIDAVPNQAYTLSVIFGGYVSFSIKPTMYIAFYDTAGALITTVDLLSASNGLQSVTTTSPGTTVSLKIVASCVGAGAFTFANDQLELGSVATPFEPQ